MSASNTDGIVWVLGLATMHGIVADEQWRPKGRTSLGLSFGTARSVAKSTMSVMYWRGRLDGEPKSEALRTTDESAHMFWNLWLSTCSDGWNCTFSTSLEMCGFTRLRLRCRSAAATMGIARALSANPRGLCCRREKD